MLTGAFEFRNVDGSLYFSLMECLGSRNVSCLYSFLRIRVDCSDYVRSNDKCTVEKRGKNTDQHLICFRIISIRPKTALPQGRF